MGLLDDLTLEPETKRKCKIGVMLDTLDENDVKILADAIDNTAWVAENLATALTQRGLKVSHQVIRRHRRGQCTC